jgi:hypothetical protein
MWLVFYTVLRKQYLRYKTQTKKGEKWVLRMSYILSYGLMIKTHESMFGLLCYGLLMQFTCLTFNSVVGIFSFLAALSLLSYLLYNIVNLYCKLNGKHKKS